MLLQPPQKICLVFGRIHPGSHPVPAGSFVVIQTRIVPRGERITANFQKAGSADAFKVVSPATAPEKPAFFSYPNISPVVRKPEQLENTLRPGDTLPR